MLENKSYDPHYTFMLAGLRYVVPVSRLFFRAFAPRALAGCWAAGPGAPWKQGARCRRGSGGAGGRSASRACLAPSRAQPSVGGPHVLWAARLGFRWWRFLLYGLSFPCTVFNKYFVVLFLSCFLDKELCFSMKRLKTTDFPIPSSCADSRNHEE